MLIEVVQPKRISEKLEQEILVFVDGWLKSVYANRMLNCKSKLEVSFGYKKYEVLLRLSITESDISKGIYMPFFTQVSY